MFVKGFTIIQENGCVITLFKTLTQLRNLDVCSLKASFLFFIKVMSERRINVMVGFFMK